MYPAMTARGFIRTTQSGDPLHSDDRHYFIGNDAADSGLGQEFFEFQHRGKFISILGCE